MNFPKVEVVIEIPRGSFLKRDSAGRIDFFSPFPCPFNYGSVLGSLGSDGDPLDAVVLGARLPRGARLSLSAYGAVELLDRGKIDDKLICGASPPGRVKRFFILLFFRFYSMCKRILYLLRGATGSNQCLGWSDAVAAIDRARSKTDMN